jgi:hypothetical protein
MNRHHLLGTAPAQAAQSVVESPAPAGDCISWHMAHDPQAAHRNCAAQCSPAGGHLAGVAHEGLSHIISGRCNPFQCKTGRQQVPSGPCCQIPRQ